MLDKPALEAEILQAFEDASLDDNSTPLQRRQLVAQKLAAAVDKFVKTGTVLTTGSATTQTGNIT